MLKTFNTHIDNKLSFLKDSTLLIAISGGLDSVILTHLCHQLNLNIALAHCNFNLRGSESDADENFVIALADRLDLEVFVEHFSTIDYANQHKLSTQMAARELRYNWFFDLAESLKFDFILTAHHADDNLESFLINLTRGTGLSGLTGIPEVNDIIVRPLLPFSRNTLKHYAKEQNLQWREDSSNASDKYLRNKLRHHVIPVLKETNSNLLKNFKTTLDNLNDSRDIVAESLNTVAKQAIDKTDNNQLKFKISELKKLENPKAYLFELFNTYGFTAWEDVLSLLDAQSGKQILSQTHRLIKDREHLILTDLNVVDESYSERNKESIKIKATTKKIKTPAGMLFFDEADAIFGKRSNVIFVDRDSLKFPLEIRKWKEGDAFYPLGMKGKKKLSKYFKDEKLSLVDKENVWLLISEDNIVWVMDKRADDRFKVNKKTKHILKIEIVGSKF